MNHNGANAENSIGVYSTFLFTDVVQQILEESDPADPLMVYISWQNVHARRSTRRPSRTSRRTRSRCSA